jgi:hypothetical protein
VNTFADPARTVGTVLYVRTECTDQESEVACDDGWDPPGGLGTGRGSRVEFQAEADRTYYVFVEREDQYMPRVYFWIGPCPTSEICEDGLDNDGNQLPDCDDPVCAFLPPCFEPDCRNGVDDDGDGVTDCRDPDCDPHNHYRDIDAPRLEPGTCIEDDCSNGVDDEGDGPRDCEDLDCYFDPICFDPQVCRDLPTLAPGRNAGDTTDTGNHFDGLCTGGLEPGDQAWALPVVRDEWYCLDTYGSATSTLLSVRTQCDDPASEFICNEGFLSDAARLQFRAAASTTYTVIAENYYLGAFSGPYVINLAARACSEVVCNDVADEDADGATDCDDSDCRLSPACWEIDCTDGADNDGDGLTDCEDPLGCAYDPACLPSGVCDNPPALVEGRNEGTTAGGSDHFVASCGGAETFDDVRTLTTPSDTAVCLTIDYNGMLYVREDCLDPASEIACNEDQPFGDPFGGKRAQLQFDAVRGRRYYVIYDGEQLAPGEGPQSQMGSYRLDVAFGPCSPPVSP